MGCVKTKEKKNTGKEDDLWGKQNPMKLLTEFEIRVIKLTWNKFTHNEHGESTLTKNAVDIYCDYFHAFPEVKKHFQDMDIFGRTLADMRLNPSPNLCAHSLAVITELNLLIEGLEDVRKSRDHLMDNGNKRYKIGMTVQALVDFFFIVLLRIQLNVGDELDSSATQTWDKFIKLMVETMVMGYEQAAKEQSEADTVNAGMGVG